MTLLDLANHICAQLGLSDTDDVSAAKMFLQRRLEMIWNTQIWRSSLVEATMTVAPDGTCTLADTIWIPSRSTLLLPSAIDSVLAVRADNHLMSVASLESYYRTDTDWLNMQGDPTEFQVLQSANWEFATSTTVGVESATAGSLRSSVDGVTNQTAVLLANTVANIEALRIDNAASANAVSISVPRGAAVTPMAFPQHIYCLPVVLPNPPLGTVFTQWDLTFASPVAPPAGGYAIYKPNAALYPWAQDGTQYQINIQFGANGSYVANAGTDNATMSLWTSTLVYDRGPWDGSASLPSGYPPTPPQLWVNNDGSGNSYTIQFYLEAACNTPWDLSLPDLPAFLGGQLIAADIRSQHQRIRLTTNPQTSVNLRVLGKRACAVLGDYDSAPISNVEPCLMAFARADILLRQRQHGKAQVAMQEGATLLAQLARSEAFQTANNFRIVPDAGFGAESPLWTQPNSFHPI